MCKKMTAGNESFAGADAAAVVASSSSGTGVGATPRGCDDDKEDKGDALEERGETARVSGARETSALSAR
jgi:hypothetical protein